MGSVCFRILRLSPVRILWSILRVMESMFVRRTSAGILSPTAAEREGERGRERERDGRMERERGRKREREGGIEGGGSQVHSP